MRSEACSPMKTLGAWVWPRMIVGHHRCIRDPQTLDATHPSAAGRPRLRRRCPSGRCRPGGRASGNSRSRPFRGFRRPSVGARPGGRSSPSTPSGRVNAAILAPFAVPTSVRHGRRPRRRRGIRGSISGLATGSAERSFDAAAAVRAQQDGPITTAAGRVAEPSSKNGAGAKIISRSGSVEFGRLRTKP